jgi:hypothetical protein
MELSEELFGRPVPHPGLVLDDPYHAGFLVVDGEYCIGATHVSYWTWPDGHVDRGWVVDSAYEPIPGQFPSLHAAEGAVRAAWAHHYEAATG